MGRKCSAKTIKEFKLTDTQIETVYESKIKSWPSGGAYIPIPNLGNKKVYVVVRK